MDEYELLAKQFECRDGELYIRGIRRGKDWRKPSGTIGSKGYKQVKVNGRTYQVHIVIWILHYKKRPKGEIDHWDKDKLNNRIENLRDRTHRENMLNTPRSENRALPHNIDMKRGRYRVRIRLGWQRKEYYYKTLEEAVAKRDELLGMAITPG